MPKRIILCLDGTWESVDQGAPNIPSNVARLSRMIARQGISCSGDPIDQIVYYQPGVGTGPMNKVDKYYQGITGAGIRNHLLSAYNFVATNYSHGDEIFLFGYSRGAYTARALGWFLTKLGVLKPEDLDLFPGLFRHFKRGSGRIEFSDVSPYEELRGVKTKPTPIEIVVEGVWETVGKVHHAFQALALDEHRGAFTPAIWYLEPKFKDKVNLKQCWFPGYHGEVGGGVAGPLGRNRLAIEDITLAWMCDQVDGLLTFD
ncbi:hypothetical protein NA56DRAFT_574685, partial [Hyaloscypha hepaticicola]